jgi:hypothetical protein
MSIIKKRDHVKSLLTLHKQAKFWAAQSRKFDPWVFFVVNNGEVPNCDKIQQLRCNICFPHVGPPSLIEKKTKSKKGIIAFNKSYGIGSVKHHVVALHLDLLLTYVVEHFVHDNIGSQERSDEGSRLMQPTKKRTKVTTRVISSFFGTKIPYKRHGEALKLFSEDLVLLTAKGYLPLNTCENVKMHRLALRLDSKLVFPT